MSLFEIRINASTGGMPLARSKFGVRCVLLLGCGEELLLQTKKGMQKHDDEDKHRYLRIPCVDLEVNEDEQAALRALVLERLGLDICPECFHFVRMIERLEEKSNLRQLRLYRLELHPEVWGKIPLHDRKHHRLTRATRTSLHSLLHPADIALAMAA